MDTAEKESNYTRINLLLVKGGTMLVKRLFLQRVKDLSPQGKVLTVEEFLEANKARILRTSTGKHQEHTLYPHTGGINFDEWDLHLFCFILQEACKLTSIHRLDVEKLQKMRNKLCHLPEPTLSYKDFEELLKILKIIFKRSQNLIKDKSFEEEIDALVAKYENDPIPMEEIVKFNHNFIRSELERTELLCNQKKMMEMTSENSGLLQGMQKHMQDIQGKLSANCLDNGRILHLLQEMLDNIKDFGNRVPPAASWNTTVTTNDIRRDDRVVDSMDHLSTDKSADTVKLPQTSQEADFPSVSGNLDLKDESAMQKCSENKSYQPDTDTNNSPPTESAVEGRAKSNNDAQSTEFQGNTDKFSESDTNERSDSDESPGTDQVVHSERKIKLRSSTKHKGSLDRTYQNDTQSKEASAKKRSYEKHEKKHSCRMALEPRGQTDNSSMSSQSETNGESDDDDSPGAGIEVHKSCKYGKSRSCTIEGSKYGDNQPCSELKETPSTEIPDRKNKMKQTSAMPMQVQGNIDSFSKTDTSVKTDDDVSGGTNRNVQAFDKESTGTEKKNNSRSSSKHGGSTDRTYQNDTQSKEASKKESFDEKHEQKQNGRMSSESQGNTDNSGEIETNGESVDDDTLDSCREVLLCKVYKNDCIVTNLERKIKLRSSTKHKGSSDRTYQNDTQSKEASTKKRSYEKHEKKHSFRMALEPRGQTDNSSMSSQSETNGESDDDDSPGAGIEVHKSCKYEAGEQLYVEEDLDQERLQQSNAEIDSQLKEKEKRIKIDEKKKKTDSLNRQLKEKKDQLVTQIEDLSEDLHSFAAAEEQLYVEEDLDQKIERLQQSNADIDSQFKENEKRIKINEKKKKTDSFNLQLKEKKDQLVTQIEAAEEQLYVEEDLDQKIERLQQSNADIDSKLKENEKRIKINEKKKKTDSFNRQHKEKKDQLVTQIEAAEEQLYEEEDLDQKIERLQQSNADIDSQLKENEKRIKINEKKKKTDSFISQLKEKKDQLVTQIEDVSRTKSSSVDDFLYSRAVSDDVGKDEKPLPLSFAKVQELETATGAIQERCKGDILTEHLKGELEKLQRNIVKLQIQSEDLQKNKGENKTEIEKKSKHFAIRKLPEDSSTLQLNEDLIKDGVDDLSNFFATEDYRKTFADSINNKMPQQLYNNVTAEINDTDGSNFSENSVKDVSEKTIAQWFWTLGAKAVPFTDEVSRKIEHDFQRKSMGSTVITQDNKRHRIIFPRMVNIDTKEKFNITRTEFVPDM